jgi:DNA-binding SARP family transcriptional activator/tetratricopeptide (TPR) repeat protein
MTKPNQIDAFQEPAHAITHDQPRGIPGWNSGIPVIRISTCGPFTVETLEALPEGNADLARYTTLSQQRVREHDGRALPLLKLLSNAEGRFVSKDTLMTLLCEERKASITEKTLQNIVSSLRDLLALSSHTKIPDLIVYVKATKQSGDGYRLAAFPLVWLDSDAIAWNIKTATLKQRFNDDPFPYWERAYQLASRGTYLIEEPFSDWAQARRETLRDQLRLCVHALSRLSLIRFGEAGEAEVMLMLLSYCRMDPQDEDALRVLLELLCKRERYREVLEWYDRLEAALDEAGLTKTGKVRTPHPSTAEIAAYAQLKQREEHQMRSELLRLTPPVGSLPTPPDGDLNLVSSTVHTPSLPPSPAIVLLGPHASTGAGITRVSEVSSGEDEPVHADASVFDHLEAFTGPLHSETHHLIGREAWLLHFVQMVRASLPKKLIILHGPIGIGKSSELNRLAEQFRQVDQGGIDVVAPVLFAIEQHSDPEAALDVFLGMVLHECKSAPFPTHASRTHLTNLALAALEQHPRPLVILLDNAECLLTEHGRLAPCWETFLTRYLRSRHQTTLILATKEWHGWSGRDSRLLAETEVPPLSPAECASLLQYLGLENVPVEQLQAVGTYLAGLPLLLEWTAKLVTDPLLFAYWEGADESKTRHQTPTMPEGLTERLQQLLDNPSFLGEHLANKLSPLLQCLLEKYLSAEARLVLNRLALANIPLGKPALQILCPRLDLLQELRSASLLAAYTNRIQVLPVVAWTVQHQITSEQRREAEDVVIEAYTRWLDEGNLEIEEAGAVVTELAVLLLRHQRLLEVAQLLIRYGWMSFNLGYGPRLAYLAQTILRQVDWHDTEEHECAGLVLVHILFQFLGQPLDSKKYANYQRIRDAIIAKSVMLPAAIGIYVTHLLMLDATNCARFEEARTILDAYSTYLKYKTSLLGEQAFLLGAWSDYAEEQGNKQQARHLREQTIDLYKQLALFLSSQQGASPPEQSISKKRLATCLNNLAYHLNIMGFHEEALQMIEQSIPLKEQGYSYVGALAASYGEKAEILMELGRFQEALVFDEKAMAEIQRCANGGDALSIEELSIYQIIRGRLYLCLGKVDEAERLLQEALPHVHPTKRRMYRMFAEDGLNEIKQWRQQSVTPQYQLDWRWVERYRELCTYDSRWWLTWAGPFTEEEQAQWDQLFALPLDDVTKPQLGALIKVSRERELAAAITEQREPRLQYPAIAIEDIRRRIEAQLVLEEEINQQEPNALVRRFYQGAIEEELGYLRLIEATYEGNSEQFWECNRRLFPLPSKENMAYAFARIKHVVRQGLENAQTAEVSQQLQEFIHVRLHLSLELTPEEEARPERIQSISSSATTQQRMVLAQTAQHFFTTVLREGGYTDWLVTIDPNATSARVEQGARQVYLPEKRFSLDEVKHLFIHELAGHVARLIAGTHSPLGLLGIHTKNCLPIDEGLALYYERQAAILRGEPFDDSGIRMATLALGLACGVMTPPQTFLSLFTFLERYSLLARLLSNPEADREKLQKQARQYALTMCLRKYRGVPDLEQAGVCYLQDVVYLHGLRLIEKAVASDETVLDRLAVGNVALEHLPDLQELGIVSAPLPFRKLVFDPDLDAYILSFAQSEEGEETSQ